MEFAKGLAVKTIQPENWEITSHQFCLELAILSRDIELMLAHLNTAGHCRRYDIEQTIKLNCKVSNLNRWQKYPREFTRFWKGKIHQ